MKIKLLSLLLLGSTLSMSNTSYGSAEVLYPDDEKAKELIRKVREKVNNITRPSSDSLSVDILDSSSESIVAPVLFGTDDAGELSEALSMNISQKTRNAALNVALNAIKKTSSGYVVAQLTSALLENSENVDDKRLLQSLLEAYLEEYDFDDTKRGHTGMVRKTLEAVKKSITEDAVRK
jgi:hypothetical protein